MSVSVNLLPDEVRANERAVVARIIAGASAGVFLAALGGVWLWQQSQVDDAEAALAAQQAENAELQAEITELAPFATLTQERDAAASAVTTALGREASLAGVLQDLSSVLPPTAELTGVTLAMADSSAAPAVGGRRLVEGRMSVQGQVLVGIAPGVERMLVAVDRVAAFDNAFVGTTTTVDDVTAFTMELELGPEVLSERYSTESQEDVR